MGKMDRARWPRCSDIVVRGRRFSQGDVVAIRRQIRIHPNWGRTRLSQAICSLLDWKQPNGRLKERACRVALLRLEQLGFVKLPARLIQRGGRPPKVHRGTTEITRNEITDMPTAVVCRLVGSDRESRLWNSLIAEHHYLGLATPVGRLVRYLVFGDEDLLGAISFGECAWNLAVRNRVLAAVGIGPADIPNAVIGNNRFLILPSVRVPNLASRVLANSARSVERDWTQRYGTSPLVAETFVDPRRYEGTCYRAANWLCIGATKGFAKSGGRHIHEGAPKLVFLRGLTPNVHRRIEQAITGLQLRAA